MQILRELRLDDGDDGRRSPRRRSAAERTAETNTCSEWKQRCSPHPLAHHAVGSGTYLNPPPHHHGSYPEVVEALFVWLKTYTAYESADVRVIPPQLQTKDE